MMSFFKNNKSSFFLLGSMVAGAAIGAAWGPGAAVLQPLADLFLNLLYCVVVPMIFVSLVSSIANMKSLQKLRNLLVVMMIIFLLTQVFASIYMVGVCAVFDPGQGVAINMTEEVKDLKSNSNVLAMFTTNDFLLLWSRKNLMALIVFSMMVGVGLLSLGEKGRTLVAFFDEGTQLIMKVVGYVMKIAPLGLSALFATLVGEYGSEFTGSLAKALIIYFIAAIVYFILSGILFSYIGGGAEGIRRYFRHCLPPTLMALGTCSSAASMPTNFTFANKCGISKEVGDLVIPLGTNLQKDGACLITVLKIAFMCSVFGINFMDPAIIFKTIICATLASMVMGAIPAGGYVGELFIISMFGFPAVSIPVMVLIGTITDAPATAINVTIHVSSAMIVERFVNGKRWIEEKCFGKQDPASSDYNYTV